MGLVLDKWRARLRLLRSPQRFWDLVSNAHRSPGGTAPLSGGRGVCRAPDGSQYILGGPREQDSRWESYDLAITAEIRILVPQHAQIPLAEIHPKDHAAPSYRPVPAMCVGPVDSGTPPSAILVHGSGPGQIAGTFKATEAPPAALGFGVECAQITGAAPLSGGQGGM